ncbi:MAG: LPD7 domain-containing protein [Lamprobacter sp.]|uniref:LPD7 domain-containing protein n=1 Tax=Lamprobacter sp. TaxID=3100796 RepID=UPI002B2624AD|nr:LPD7 domain-containing protein [Lamprobacter sp.]MEA3641963.1 LPD7 domain-containing protein [Lamprobacter sp.]
MDWDQLRSGHGSAEKIYAALDPGFRSTMKVVAESDREPVIKMLRELVPREVASVMAASWARGPFDLSSATASPGVPEAVADEPNEISRDRTREAAFAASAQQVQVPTPYPETASTAVSTGKTYSDQLPAFVNRHFVRAGDEFFYRQTLDKLAFEARGDSFCAHDSSVSVATAMVEMAEARGWSALKVKGTKDFRRLVWAAAAKRGISVDGYSPSAGERAMLEQEQAMTRPARSVNSESRVDGRQRERPTDRLAGILVDHGAAPYQNQQENSASYFVALRSESGEVTTLWGLDLERAIDDAKAEIGDQVQLGRSGKQRVQIQKPIRDRQGKVVDQVVTETKRSTWAVTVISRSDRTRGAQEGQRRGAGDDPIASKVVELFTAERLGKLPPEEQARFRELYEQARTRLASRENCSSSADIESRSDRNTISRNRHRERASQGR